MVTLDPGLFEGLMGAYAVVVTPLGGLPVTTIVQWDQEGATPAEQQVGTGALSAVNCRVVVSVRRDHVPTLPAGSTIMGGPEHNTKPYRVHSVDASDPQYHVAVIL